MHNLPVTDLIKNDFITACMNLDKWDMVEFAFERSTKKCGNIPVVHLKRVNASLSVV